MARNRMKIGLIIVLALGVLVAFMIFYVQAGDQGSAGPGERAVPVTTAPTVPVTTTP